MRVVLGGRGVVTGTNEDFSEAVYHSHPTVAYRSIAPFCACLHATEDVNLYCGGVFYEKNQ